MFYLEQSDWESPDPNSEPDHDKIIIPKVPYDDDVSEDNDSDEEEEED